MVAYMPSTEMIPMMMIKEIFITSFMFSWKDKARIRGD